MANDHEEDLPATPEASLSRRLSLQLLRRLIVYHVALFGCAIALALVFPEFVPELPVGGIRALEAGGDVSVEQAGAVAADVEVAAPLVGASSGLDRLGYARQLVIALAGIWLLMLPISWVHKGIHRGGAHDHSLDETTFILPGVVTSIVMVVQHSLALAFSLAGIVAGVQFRRALQDTFDTLFILVAIGVGIAAGVGALEIAAVLTVFFTYGTLYVYFLGDGLQSDFDAEKKRVKRLREEKAESAHAPPADP